MEYVEWSDDLSIELEEIDTQHKKFIEILNQLQHILEEKNHRKKMGIVLFDLVNYTKFHFGTEERYMVAYDYGMKESHMAIHKDFVMKISEFARNYLYGKRDIDEELLSYLVEWLKEHIRTVDKEFGAFLLKKGVVLKTF